MFSYRDGDYEARSMTDKRENIRRELAQQLEKLCALRRPEGRDGVTPTGIPPLDDLLPDGGFRDGTFIEWLGESASGAEQLALLAARPMLRDRGPLIVIDAEKAFYPPAAAPTVDLEQVIAVRPATLADALWALEQSLQCPGVGLTLCRLERLSARAGRRLQLAAERGGGLGFVVRPPAARGQPSWSDLQLSVESVSSESPGRRWQVELLRSRRGAGERAVLMEYDDATNDVHSPSELAPRAPVPKAARA